MSLERDFASYLQDQGVGTVGTDIFVNQLPDTPANCIAVYATGGINIEKEVPVSDDTIQVIVRNKDNSTCTTKAEAVYTACKRKSNINLVGGGVYVLFMNPVAKPQRIGRDEAKRYEASINITLKTRETSNY